MPEGCVPYIMAERNRFDQVFVQSQASSYRPGNLGDQLDMQYPVRDVVILNKVKDLSLVNVPGI